MFFVSVDIDGGSLLKIEFSAMRPGRSSREINRLALALIGLNNS
jgi:hypothetical protein